MAHRGQITSLDERLRIRDLAAAGHADASIATLIHRSIWTVRKWRRRAAGGALAPLQPRLGRPPRGPLATVTPTLRDSIRQLRIAHPGWGAQTIRGELRCDPRWCDARIPSRSRIGAFLRAAGLTRRYQQHTTLPTPGPLPPLAPHTLWQLDAQGVTQVTGLGQVSLINIVDVASRIKVESAPAACWAPGLADYQLALRRAFLHHGLPLQLSFDHGTVFFDNTSPSPFPTRIHLWLVALGVAVQFTRKRRPTDHAIVERGHQTMTRQALTGQTWTEVQALWQGLDERRWMLNTQLPSRACANQAPLQRDPQAAHSGRLYRPEWEADLLDMRRVGTYLAGAYWVRQGSPNGAIGLGGIKYWVGPAIANQAVHITFDPDAWEFRLHTVGAATALRLTPQGLSKAVLMGDAAGLLRLPAHQLALPWCPELWRSNQYAALPESV